MTFWATFLSFALLIWFRNRDLKRIERLEASKKDLEAIRNQMVKQRNELLRVIDNQQKELDEIRYLLKAL